MDAELRIDHDPPDAAEIRGSHTLQDLRSPGEALDRLSILSHKVKRHSDNQLRAICQKELDILAASWRSAGLRDYERYEGYRLLYELNAQLWGLEDSVREAERDQRFGTKFSDDLRSIHTLNRWRSDLRRDVDADVASFSDVTLLEFECGLDCYLDRISIGQIAEVRRPDSPTGAWRLWNDLWIAAGLSRVTDSPSFRRLRHAHDRLWDIKDTLDAWIDGSEFSVIPETVGRSLYLVNDARCRIKRDMAADCGSALWETKKYPAYAIPEGWDAERLDWVAGPSQRDGGGPMP